MIRILLEDEKKEKQKILKQLLCIKNIALYSNCYFINEIIFINYKKM